MKFASQEFLNEHELAAALHVSVTTVRRWRLRNEGPKYLKVGNAVRYPQNELDQWLRSREAGGALSEEPVNEAATSLGESDV